jgi:hypothetical protein
MDGMVDAEVAGRNMRLVDGFVTTQLLYVAVIRMDLHMLILLGARGRTEAEFRTLLGNAGLTVRQVVRTGSAAGLGIIESVAG